MLDRNTITPEKRYKSTLPDYRDLEGTTSGEDILFMLTTEMGLNEEQTARWLSAWEEVTE